MVDPVRSLLTYDYAEKEVYRIHRTTVSPKFLCSAFTARFSPERNAIAKQNSGELTHDLDLERAACTVAFGVLGHASVRRLVGVAFHVLDDQRAVREDLLLAVDGQRAVF